MNVKIRNELQNDRRKVEEVTRDAFWDYFQPGADEHFILHCLRKCDDFIPELNFIAEIDGKIVGNIVYTKSKIVFPEGKIITDDVVTFGPLCVLKEYRKLGIGRSLVNHSVEVARKMGFSAIIIFGDPRYYGRLGFRCGEKFDIKTPGDKYAAALMVLPLSSNIDYLIGGQFHESTAFDIDAKDLDDFDSTFEPREKTIGTDSRRDFQVLRSLQYKAD